MASRTPFGTPNNSDRSQQLAGAAIPLQTSKFANQQEKPNHDTLSKKPKASGDVMETLMKKLQDSEVTHFAPRINTPGPKLFSDIRTVGRSSSNGSFSIAPADTKEVADSASSHSDNMDAVSAANVAELKRLLASQQQQIASMQRELEQTRHVSSSTQHTGDDRSEVESVDNETIARFRGLMNTPVPSETAGPNDQWQGAAPGRFTACDVASVAAGTPSILNYPFAQTSGLQPNNLQSLGSGNSLSIGGGVPLNRLAGPDFNASMQKFTPATVNPQMQRHGLAPLRIEPTRGLGGYMGMGQPTPTTSKEHILLQGNLPSRPPSAIDPRFMAYSGYPAHVSPGHSVPGLSPPHTPMPFQSMNSGMQTPVGHPSQGHPYMLRPIGTRPSPPPGGEYNANITGPWNAQVTPEIADPVYIPPVEPLNYRRLLERDASCNWEYIVEKIICNNDQQASIFLQQKLKQAAPEHKFQIIHAIIQKCYPLMTNRFGNFLVQRCFEHGTEDQVIAIANAIRGNTLALSMDAFGCHVVQKAFDVVPEEHKAMMVHELLRNIPQTVIHRYACHVWQKLFELRWSDSPPQIMKYVNEALSGMWHSVALGETGSLVVQNIFENCLEEDKRPCIDECLASIDEISRGQFGNWCIQHICEHGATKDRVWAIDHILRHAQDYSMDQYASKVVEKCLKIGGDDFMDRYLDRVCEPRPDRPRQAIIDIAGDQYGNYLVQWILANASAQHRDVVSTHVRKHMVSLRGSKYGSRVAMLCSNPQSATRPGAPAGFQLNRYNGNASASTGTLNTGRPSMGQAYR